MTRRLFRFASVVSLLLCIATVALWTRSYCVHDDFEYFRGRQGYDQLEASRGMLSVLHYWGHGAAERHGFEHRAYHSPEELHLYLNTDDFNTRHFQLGRIEFAHNWFWFAAQCLSPIWVIATAFGGLALICLWLRGVCASRSRH
jgi:hypothetical protein